MSFHNTARRLLVAIAAVSSFAQAHAQKTPADSLGPRTELEFCATYLPCAISVGIMDGAAEAQSRLEKLRNFFSGWGRSKPAMSAAEFQAFTEAQTPEWRKAQVARCTDIRGSYMQDYCEESYLTASELRQAKEARAPKRVEMSASLAKMHRSEIYDRDSNIMSRLMWDCDGSRANSEECARTIQEFGSLKADADRLSSDKEYRKFEGAIELRSLAVALKTHEFDGTRWVRNREQAAAFNHQFDGCEQLRRDTFSAIDDRQFDQGKSLAQKLKAECASVHSQFAGMADYASARIAKEAPPDPLAALPRRGGTTEGSDGAQLMAQTLARAQRGEALDDKTLPGRGGAATNSSSGGDAGIQALAGMFQAVAQGSGRAASNPVMAGLLQGMNRANGGAESGGETAISSSQPSTTGQSAGGGEQASFSGNCEADLKASDGRRAPPGTGNSLLIPDVLYSLDRSLDALERSCRSHPKYAQWVAGYKQQRESVMRTCRSAYDPSVCVPKKGPW